MKNNVYLINISQPLEFYSKTLNSIQIYNSFIQLYCKAVEKWSILKLCPCLHLIYCIKDENKENTVLFKEKKNITQVFIILLQTSLAVKKWLYYKIAKRKIINNLTPTEDTGRPKWFRKKYTFLLKTKRHGNCFKKVAFTGDRNTRCFTS